MSAFIYKLTGIDGQEIYIGQNELTVYKIIEMTRDKDKTRLVIVTKRGGGMGFMATGDEHSYYTVKETPEQILAMIGGTATPAAQPATPTLPKVMTVDELRVGDEIEINGTRHRICTIDLDHDFEVDPSFATTSFMHESDAEVYLSRGVQVYRDGVCISGWPVDQPPWGGDAGKIAQEAISKFTDVAESCLGVNIVSSEDLRIAIGALVAEKNGANQRCKEAEFKLAVAQEYGKQWLAESTRLHDELEAAKSELAALKAKPAEVPPLDPWQVLATGAKYLRAEANSDGGYTREERRRKLSFLLAADAIVAANSGELGLEPYPLK